MGAKEKMETKIKLNYCCGLHGSENKVFSHFLEHKLRVNLAPLLLLDCLCVYDCRVLNIKQTSSSTFFEQRMNFSLQELVLLCVKRVCHRDFADILSKLENW